MLTLYTFEFSLIAAVTAYVWVNLIVGDNTIFEQFSLFIWKKCDKPWKEKLYSLLFKCNICLSGQIALWSYIIINYAKYNGVQHFLIVVFTLIISKILNTYA